MRIIPYQPEHVFGISLQPTQQDFASVISPAYAEALAGPCAYSGEVGGRIVMCAGVADMGEGRGIAWALVDPAAGASWTQIHKFALRVLSGARFRRIEATCNVDFPQGHRWLRMLGFQMEARCMRAYRPDGGDASLYARVQ